MVSASNLVFLDIETTGLEPGRHEVWEIAWFDMSRDEGRWVQLEPRHLYRADPESLEISGFMRRFGRQVEHRGVAIGSNPEVILKDDFEAYWALWRDLADVLSGKVLAGIGPWFDVSFIREYFKRANLEESWDYHLIDVKQLVAGALLAEGKNVEFPLSTTRICEQIDIERTDAHTAVGDVDLAMGMYWWVWRNWFTTNLKGATRIPGPLYGGHH